MHLTVEEYQDAYNKILRLFAAAQHQHMERTVWNLAERGISTTDARLLWLFVFALNTWTHDDKAVNYLTERQVLDIIARANTIHAT